MLCDVIWLFDNGEYTSAEAVEIHASVASEEIEAFDAEVGLMDPKDAGVIIEYRQALLPQS